MFLLPDIMAARRKKDIQGYSPHSYYDGILSGLFLVLREKLLQGRCFEFQREHRMMASSSGIVPEDLFLGMVTLIYNFRRSSFKGSGGYQTSVSVLFYLQPGPAVTSFEPCFS